MIATPLPARTTLLDDPLRALRAIRFSARFGFRIADELLSACADPDVHAALSAKVGRSPASSPVASPRLRSRPPALSRVAPASRAARLARRPRFLATLSLVRQSREDEHGVALPREG